MATNKLHTMTDAELDILARSSDNPNLFFDYWFKKPGQKRGWQLDYNFDPQFKWQEIMCMASQTFIVAICGICTGKTLGVVMSAAYHATMTPSFKFLNVAAQGFQSGLMHSALLEQAKDTPFEKLIVASPTRPRPVITIAYKIGEQVFRSTLEFLSPGEKGDATNIMSWRGDWINIEEAGLIDNLDEIVGNLATRLTGNTADGREFLARFTLISNAWDNLALWQLYDMTLADTEDGLVFNINTAANKNATDRQVKLALKRVPAENHEKFMTGNRPQGRGDFFDGNDILRCESQEMTEIIRRGYKEKKPGFVIKEDALLGVYHYEMPRQDGRIYYVVGDPGTGTAPFRNAPTLAVYDVTDGSRFSPMVAFWWGNGTGQITPFYMQTLNFIEKYSPLDTFVDNTGLQKNTVEIVNMDYLDELKKLGVRSIKGLSFASVQKVGYLRALQVSIESHSMPWPSFLKKSVSAQMGNYSYEKDKSPNSKLAQDIVAVQAMAAFAIRAWRRKNDKKNSEDDGEDGNENIRDRRSNNRARTSRRDPRRQPSQAQYPT